MSLWARGLTMADVLCTWEVHDDTAGDRGINSGGNAVTLDKSCPRGSQKAAMKNAHYFHTRLAAVQGVYKSFFGQPAPGYISTGIRVKRMYLGNEVSVTGSSALHKVTQLHQCMTENSTAARQLQMKHHEELRFWLHKMEEGGCD